VTYSEPVVADTIQSRFVGVQIDTMPKSSKAVVECYRQAWTPDVRLLDCTGFDFYRWNGYLPPFEFLPRLLVAEAQANLRLQHNQLAAAQYDEVLRRFPTSLVGPEAEYYLGVARYKDSHEARDLMQGWHQLQRDHPWSSWRLKQSFTEQERLQQEQPHETRTAEQVRPPEEARATPSG
jgi:hypothetical protein